MTILVVGLILVQELESQVFRYIPRLDAATNSFLKDFRIWQMKTACPNIDNLIVCQPSAMEAEQSLIRENFVGTANDLALLVFIAVS